MLRDIPVDIFFLHYLNYVMFYSIYFLKILEIYLGLQWNTHVWKEMP